MTQFQKFAWVAAVVFVLIGILGFVPGVTDEADMLFGVFQVGTVNNIVFILVGVLAGIAAMASASASKMYFQLFGVIFALVTILGFIQGDTVLGIMNVNSAANWLHLVFALVYLAVGFGMKESSSSAQM